MEEYSNFMERIMSLYMAPEKTIQTYVDGLMYKEQKISEKEIGVDTACYLINVDGLFNERKQAAMDNWGAC